MSKVNLSHYDNSWYSTQAGAVKRLVWFFANALFLMNPFNPVSSIKVFLLRMFGARIGKGVTIKPAVNIKYPWLLEIGDHVWIGEKVWIDNLVKVKIGDHCCLSQGVMLLTGNHNYKQPAFDLMVGSITLEDGVWIGANAVVCPGITCASHSILAVSSVANRNLEAYGIYQGNPAQLIKTRVIS